MTHWQRQQTGRQAYYFRVIGSSSARMKERLTDGDVIVVEVFREPLLGQGLLRNLRDKVVLGLETCGGVFFVRVDRAPQRKCAWLYPRHQGNRCTTGSRAEEIRDEMNGEVEEVTQRAHETWRWRWCEQNTNLSHNVCIYPRRHSKDNDSNRQQKERQCKTKDLQCRRLMNWYQQHSNIFQMFQVTSHVVEIFALHFLSPNELLSLYQFDEYLTCTRVPCRDSHGENGSFEVLSLHSVASLLSLRAVLSRSGPWCRSADYSSALSCHGTDSASAAHDTRRWQFPRA